MRERYEQFGVPYLFWLIIFFLIPVFVILGYSFLQRNYLGGVDFSFSLQGYRDVLNSSFFRIFIRTIVISLLASVISIFFALPVSYYIAMSKYKEFLLLLVIIPFWTNSLIRIYSWIFILGNNGLINQILRDSFGTEKFIQFLYNNIAVTFVLVYTYLPFAIIPLYTAIEKIDKSLYEAGMDLGCSKFQVFTKILIPNIQEGFRSAFIFVFIPSLGTYAVSELIGGKDSRMLGNEIARLLTTAKNWPAAAAISALLLVVVTVATVITIFRRKKNETR